MWGAVVTAEDGSLLLLRNVRPVRLTSDIAQAARFASADEARTAAERAIEDATLRVTRPMAVVLSEGSPLPQG